MTLEGLRNLKARIPAGVRLMAAVTALAVLSGCVVVPYGGYGYHRGYYRDSYYSRY